jgi:beta-1,4-N-acetylglucosaminyltransferase
MKVCMPVSLGGHLTQALVLAEKFKGHDVLFVTSYSGRFRASGLGWRFKYVINPARNPLKFIILAIQALWILAKERPDAVISTGSNIPIPFFIIGKLMGKKLVYVESISRVSRPSLSGRLLYPIADMFFVQWERLKVVYPKAVYAGRLM